MDISKIASPNTFPSASARAPVLTHTRLHSHNRLCGPKTHSLTFRTQPSSPNKAQRFPVNTVYKRNLFCGRLNASTVEQASETEDVPVDDEVVFEIAPDVFCFRGACTKRLKFEIEYGLKRGTTDNSYLIKGPTRESTVLIDVPYQAFKLGFVETLEKEIDVGSIGHIVLTHLDPKAVPTLIDVLEDCIASNKDAKVEIHIAFPALALLRTTMGKDDRGQAALSACVFTVVKPGQKLDLGGGRELEFIKTATPRWPDMFAVYDPTVEALFTSKFFSAHVAPSLLGGADEAFDEGGWGAYGNDWKFFFDCMIAPVPNQGAKALKRMSIMTATPSEAPVIQRFWQSLLNFFSSDKGQEAAEGEEQAMRSVSVLCPMHGPVVKNSMNELVSSYTDWTANQSKPVTKVITFYASAYGNTAALAQAISRGVTKAGVGVETVNLEVAEAEEVKKAISEANGFVIGSPTLGGHMPTQVQSALGTILRDMSAKQLPCGVFGSFGWSGEAVDEMEQRLRDGGFSFGFDAIRVKFKPTAKDLQLCEESGTDLAQSILKKKKQKEKQTAASSQSRGASNTAQAMGRVVGSLCILTAKDGDAQSGMLASWISQASFDPPGLTVAVKKDRAVENFMLVGNRFNINVLSEGKEKAAMKAMLKPFGPAEDRFEGIDVEISEETGCVILPDALSVLECTVTDRMDAGDHYIVYGTVQDGKVFDAKSVSAVHHRKVGTNY